MKLRLLKIGLISCITILCGVSNSYAIELSIRNELKEYESGNILEIEKGHSMESPRTRFHVNIHPGKTVKITKGNVVNFTLVRPFKRHKLKYEISCKAPKEEARQMTVTLLEIHKNKLPEECQVDRIGHWSSRGGMTWKELNNDDDNEPKSHQLVRSVEVLNKAIRSN